MDGKGNAGLPIFPTVGFNFSLGADLGMSSIGGHYQKSMEGLLLVIDMELQGSAGFFIDDTGYLSRTKPSHVFTGGKVVL